MNFHVLTAFCLITLLGFMGCQPEKKKNQAQISIKYIEPVRPAYSFDSVSVAANEFGEEARLSSEVSLRRALLDNLNLKSGQFIPMDENQDTLFTSIANNKIDFYWVAYALLGQSAQTDNLDEMINEVIDLELKYKELVEGIEPNADLGKLKIAIESKIITDLKIEDLTYNKEARTLDQVLFEGKVQCESGTHSLLIAKIFSEKNQDGRNYLEKFHQTYPVVILEPGHILPGQMVLDENNEWHLFGTETTAKGEATVYKGLAKNLDSDTTRVVEAFDYLFIQAFAPSLSSTTEVLMAAFQRASDTYGNEMPVLRTSSINGLRDSNANLFAFGSSDQIAGNIKRSEVSSDVNPEDIRKKRSEAIKKKYEEKIERERKKKTEEEKRKKNNEVKTNGMKLFKQVLNVTSCDRGYKGITFIREKDFFTDHKAFKSKSDLLGIDPGGSVLVAEKDSNGMTIKEYLRYCFHPKVFDQVVKYKDRQLNFEIMTPQRIAMHYSSQCSKIQLIEFVTEFGIYGPQKEYLSGDGVYFRYPEAVKAIYGKAKTKLRNWCE